MAGGALWWYSDGTKGDIGATTVICIHIVDAETNSEMWSRDMSLEKPSFLQMLGLHKQQYLLNTLTKPLMLGLSGRIRFGLGSHLNILQQKS